MFGIGVTELLIISFIVLIIFGAGKIPQVMGGLGQGLRDFKQGVLYDPKDGKEETVDADFEDLKDGR